MDVIFSALRVLLGLFFALNGVVKLTDTLCTDAHRQMKNQYVQFADVFPLKDLGYKPDPEQYMLTVGWLELVSGFLLAVGPQLLQEISNFLLCVILIGVIYSILVLKEPFAMCAIAAVCLGLLLLLAIRGRRIKQKSKFE
ncbi:hypothetical protein GDO86_003572 [Hymenochirus boettgeri]|uniref:Transmembrane protein 35B n=2 Tax=Hymenochirus TaxID=8361 RepID=A0A8T2K7R6_9PIPI|nr:hypothetical protein GDO86_003572 [Hymenochirus boettgeri]